MANSFDPKLSPDDLAKEVATQLAGPERKSRFSFGRSVAVGRIASGVVVAALVGVAVFAVFGAVNWFLSSESPPVAEPAGQPAGDSESTGSTSLSFSTTAPGEDELLALLNRGVFPPLLPTLPPGETTTTHGATTSSTSGGDPTTTTVGSTSTSSGSSSTTTQPTTTTSSPTSTSTTAPTTTSTTQASTTTTTQPTTSTTCGNNGGGKGNCN